MIKAKAGGIMLGGLAGYLILSKGLHAVERMVQNICTAREWKNYYKYGKEGNMVPPGYSRHTTTDSEGRDVQFKHPQTEKEDEREAQKNASKEASDGSFGASVAKAIIDAFADGLKGKTGSEKAEKEDSEGENKSTDEPKDICPRNCANCIIPQDKCPYSNLKPEGGVITKWVNGTPVAGRYPWGDGTDLEWSIGPAGEEDKELTPEEYAEMDRKEDMEIESIAADDIRINGSDPGDPDGLNKETSEEE